MKKIFAMLSILFLVSLPMLAVAQPADTPATPAADAAATPAAPAADAAAAAAVPTAPPGPDIDVDAATGGLLDGINRSEVTLIIGAVLMILVLILRKFVWKKLEGKSQWLPWLAVGIALLGTGGTALVADPANWINALLAGAQAGISAAGTWGLLKVARNKLKPK